MTDSKQWYVHRKDKLYGPFSLVKMKAFIAEGRIRPHSKICLGKEYPLINAELDPDLSVLFKKPASNTTPKPDHQQSQSPQLAPQNGERHPEVEKTNGQNSKDRTTLGQMNHGLKEPRKVPSRTSGHGMSEHAVSEHSDKPLVMTAKEPDNQAQIVSAPKKSDNRPFGALRNLVVVLLIFGGIIGLAYWIISTKNPAVNTVIHGLEQSSKIRTMLKKPPLPLVWDLWKPAVIDGLNFTRAEILERRKGDIEYKIPLSQFHFPPEFEKTIYTYISFIQAGGYYDTYLFDDQDFVTGIAISHANFKRLFLKNYEPTDLGSTFTVQSQGNQTLWVTKVLDNFQGSLVWEPSLDGGKHLAYILIRTLP